MKDPNKLKDLILEKIDLGEIMQEYNVNFVFNPNKAHEVQFRCPFHGKDNKPSARYYRESQSAYCWVCHKRFDVIGFIMEKLGISYGGALSHIIMKYHLDISHIPEGPDIPYQDYIKKADVPKIRPILSNINANIEKLKYKIPFEKYNILCAVYDGLIFKTSKNIDVIANAEKLESKIYTFVENM